MRVFRLARLPFLNLVQIHLIYCAREWGIWFRRDEQIFDHAETRSQLKEIGRDRSSPTNGQESSDDRNLSFLLKGVESHHWVWGRSLGSELERRWKKLEAFFICQLHHESGSHWFSSCGTDYRFILRKCLFMYQNMEVNFKQKKWWHSWKSYIKSSTVWWFIYHHVLLLFCT